MKIIISSKIAVYLCLLFSQSAFSSTAWVGDANYAVAPGADGSESTATNFTTYDFGVGASLLRLVTSNQVGNIVTGQFAGYYQSMVTDHFLGGSGNNLPDLNTSGDLGDGSGFELTLTSTFTGNYSLDVTTQLTSFSGLTGDVDLYFDTTPDFSFANDSGFDDASGTDGGAILSGDIVDGNGFVSGLFGIGVNQLELNFSGLFNGYDTNVFSPDTIGGGSALFSIDINNQSANSISNQIINGNGTVLGESIAGETVLAESDGTLSLTAVPLPASAWLLGSALLGLVSYRKKHIAV